MLTYQIYKIIHFTGLILLFLGFGGLLSASMNRSQLKTFPRIVFSISHGIGLLALMIGGFGMLARLHQMNPIPGWVYGKLACWVLMGIGISVVKRISGLISLAFVVAVGIAAFTLVTYKPF